MHARTVHKDSQQSVRGDLLYQPEKVPAGHTELLFFPPNLHHSKFKDPQILQIEAVFEEKSTNVSSKSGKSPKYVSSSNISLF